MKKVLITGGAGFIASHLIESLQERDCEIHSFDLVESTFKPYGVKWHEGDFREISSIENSIKEIKPDVVVHLGALPSVQTSILEPASSLDTNMRGTWNVMEASRKNGVKRVIFASSAAVYGFTGEEMAGKALSEDLPLKPKNPYGLAKKTGEEFMNMWSRKDLLEGEMDAVSLRFFNVYGERQRRDSAYATAIERFLYQWQSNEPLTIVPPGTQKRDVVYVKDLAKAIRSAVLSEKDFEGVAINIGSGKNYSIREIAEVVGGEGYPTVDIDPRPGDVKEVLADVNRAKELLDWKAETSFEEGIKLVKEYFRNN